MPDAVVGLLPPLWHVVGAFTLGALVGLTDLLIRYRDAPGAALRHPASLLNILLHGGLSVAALVLITIIDPLPPEAAEKDRLVRVLGAGLGAVAIAKVSLSIRVAGNDVQFGLARVIDGLLGSTDQAIDRARAAQRADTVSQIMGRVRFDQALETLPLFCFTILRHIPEDEQAAIGEQVRELAATDSVPPEVKSMLLGLLLQNVVGEAVLKEAVLAVWSHVGDGGAPPDMDCRRPNGVWPFR